MTYQVLARKWRPQGFADLIGQKPIVTALRNGLQDGRIAQAYIFSGIRGVGKTTAARLLAKALNCERGAAVGPCNECVSCREITIGSDLDVLEVDAATYSKVEQVRDLTESLRYGPARDRYKVVVLDEVHRLSRQAFDALLKIVEEPPPRVVFIFATTEIEAVPATILSRCQEYHFRRVAPATVAAHLRDIAGAERITASDSALRLIARAGEGSVRDSVALLDQLATFGGGTINEDDAARLLGGLDTALFGRLFAALLEGRSGEVVAIAREVEAEGWDPRHVYAHFLNYLRSALHLALAANSAEMELVDLGEDEAERLAERAKQAGYENILRLLHLLISSETTVRRSESAGLAAEIAWLRAAEYPKLLRVEELLSGNGPTPRGAVPAATSQPAGAAAPVSATPSRRPTTQPPAAAAALPARVENPAAVAVAASPPASREAEPEMRRTVQDSAADPQADSDRRGSTGTDALPTGSAPASSPEAFQEALAKRRQPLAAYLGHAQRVAFEDGELRITMPAGDTSLAEAIGRGGNRQAFMDALGEVFGPEARYAVDYGSGPAPAAAPTPAANRLAAAAAHPTVQSVLDIFGGRVERFEGPVEEKP